MTRAEAGELVVDLLRQLAAARLELSAWRTIAVESMHHAASLHADLARRNDQHLELLRAYRALREEHTAPSSEAA